VATGPLEAALRRAPEACHRRMTAPRTGEPSKPDDLTLLLYRRN
jgi:hypothetical protein